MDIRTYTIPEARREAVEKLVAKRQKKAAAYGIPMNVTYGEPYSKEYKVYELDHENHTKVWTGETALYEVFDLTIESEIIVKDGYRVVAMLEHLDGGNVVNVFSGDMKPEWMQMKPYCDHCNANHGLMTTFIVRHESGSEKQVGRTCLKDYCGIDPQAIGYMNALDELLVDERAERFDFGGAGIARAYNTEEVLAVAVAVYRKQGYRKSDEAGSNKSVIKEMIAQRIDPSEADKAKAREIVETSRNLKNLDELFRESDEYKQFNTKWHECVDPKVQEIRDITELTDSRFKSLDEYKEWRISGVYQDWAYCYEDEDGEYHTEGEAREKWFKSFVYKFSARKADFLVSSVRALVRNGYCKESHIGFLAFAPAAYEQYMEALKADEKKIAETAALAEQSEYVGEIGKRYTFEIQEMKLLTSWETDWGTTYLYKFLDVSGNVLVWFASTCIWEENVKTIKGTVKEHSERNGVKQTVITRCKVAA